MADIVIDVHTHMLNRTWFEQAGTIGAPHYQRSTTIDGQPCLLSDGASFLKPVPAHFDYALRIKEMDKVGVDVAIVSLTAPNCFFGTGEQSLAAAKLVNDDMADAQSRYPDRIRWMASVPWEHPELAVPELKRAVANGAKGVMQLANVNGRSLTEPAFEPVWKAIDDLALPVLVHPTSPPGTPYLDVIKHNMIGSVGFMFDTSLAIGRMIYDGFFDKFPNLKIIASHAGAALPYLVGRLDRCWEMDPGRRTVIAQPPSEYMRRIYYDTVTYRLEALKMCIDVGGVDNVMYGSDFPHGIGDMKGCLERVDSLPKRQVKKVRGANATRIFRL